LTATLEPTTRPEHSCSTYVEQSRYHVHVNVDAVGGVQCVSTLAGLTDIGLLNLIP
jgi:hypothetical protein